MTGVIYARYSSDNQREESIEGQIRENLAFAEKNGITIVETYVDRAYSAKTDNRPEFQRMIKESARKNYDVVIVWKLDRFARNRYDSAKYKAILKKNNKKVVSATEAISQGAEGIILESVLEATGIDQRTISNYETEKTYPDSASLIRLADSFGVSIDYLVGRTDRDFYTEQKRLDCIEQIESALTELKKYLRSYIYTAS